MPHHQLTEAIARPRCHPRARPLRLQAALGFDRYKLVVQVALGENRAQGVHVACRGLWDADSDNYATYAFKSDTLWCSALVFGLYVE